MVEISKNNNDSREFKWDIDKKIRELQLDYVKYQGSKEMINVIFTYKGKSLPINKTLKELGINPEKERINIMATYVGRKK